MEFLQLYNSFRISRFGVELKLFDFVYFFSAIFRLRFQIGEF